MAEMCPRSMNHRPDDFPAVECVAAGECGCSHRQLYIAGLKEALEMIEGVETLNALRAKPEGNRALLKLHEILRARISSLSPNAEGE